MLYYVPQRDSAPSLKSTYLGSFLSFLGGSVFLDPNLSEHSPTLRTGPPHT